jgi:DNA (cytosine-5)-methyltransferase 1
MARIIHEVRPRYVFVENSPMLTSRGLGGVLGDLASMGFNAKWGVLGANDIGANHQRQRIWIRAEMAYSKRMGWKTRPDEQGIDGDRKTSSQFGNCSQTQPDQVGNTKSTGFTPCLEGQRQGESWRASIGNSQWWEIEPPVDRVADGMVDRVDRLKAIGNGQVPLCAATAWRILK